MRLWRGRPGERGGGQLRRDPRLPGFTGHPHRSGEHQRCRLPHSPEDPDRGGAPHPAGDGGTGPYLTLPAVSPPARYFSIAMNSSTDGTIATIDTPKRYCHAASYWPTNLLSATGSVWFVSVVRMTRLAENSLT